jgi:poly(3-hydroxybutyrate) depolymerase
MKYITLLTMLFLVLRPAFADTYDGRPYDFFVPNNVNSPLPVVFVLHGTNTNSKKIRETSEFDKWTSHREVVTVYPNGVNGWNDGRGKKDVITSTADDVLYYEIVGGGHTWPGLSKKALGLKKRILGKNSQDIKASQTALKLWF